MSTKIEWASETWNPTRGCSPASIGCRRCYAERQAHRMNHPGGAYEGLTVKRKGGPRWSGKVITVPDALDEPRRWNTPREVFVDSMSDLFHPMIPDGFIMDVWRIMAICHWHTFIILTKRPLRMRQWVSRFSDVSEPSGEPLLAHGPDEIRRVHTSGRAHLFADMLEGWGRPPNGAAYPTFDWLEGMRWLPEVLPNVVLGVSCENQRCADERIEQLIHTPAACRVISAEPLLGAIDVRRYLERGTFCECDPRLPSVDRCNSPSTPARRRMLRCRLALTRLDGVIVGGESGPGSEPVGIDAVRSIRDQCFEAGVDFFFKQWGGFPKGKNGRVLDGRTYDALPWRRAA